MLRAASSTAMPRSKRIFIRRVVAEHVAAKSLRVRPGTTSSTSMSKRANSPRSASVRPHRANLLAEYSVQAGMPRRPHIEATLTIAGRRPRSQHRHGQAHQLRRGEEVHFHHLTQDRLGTVGEMAGAGDARVVDEHVQAVEALGHGVEQPPTLGVGGEVGRDAVASAPSAVSRPASSSSLSAERAVEGQARPGARRLFRQARPMPLDAPVIRMRAPRSSRSIESASSAVF